MMHKQAARAQSHVLIPLRPLLAECARQKKRDRVPDICSRVITPRERKEEFQKAMLEGEKLNRALIVAEVKSVQARKGEKQ